MFSWKLHFINGYSCREISPLAVQTSGSFQNTVNLGASTSQETPDVSLRTPTRPSTTCAEQFPYDPDFATPRRSRKRYETVISKFHTKNRKIRTLQTKIYRLRKKIDSLNELIAHLRSRNLISEEAETIMQVYTYLFTFPAYALICFFFI